jgi:hypothetical protein
MLIPQLRFKSGFLSVYGALLNRTVSRDFRPSDFWSNSVPGSNDSDPESGFEYIFFRGDIRQGQSPIFNYGIINQFSFMVYRQDHLYLNVA